MEPFEIVSEVLKLLKKAAVPGAIPTQLDKMAEEYILSQGGQPYNKDYHPRWAHTPFPATVCISINDTIVHGIPTNTPLKPGDLVNFDVGVYKNGTCGDAALSVGVGEISEKDKFLLKVARDVLYAGIAKVAAGVKTRDIGSAMNKEAEANGMVTNRVLCGHRIDGEMHMAPEIPNFYNHNLHDVLEEGWMICLEPEVTKKDRMGKISENGWDYKTIDKRKSACFEHQLLVTKDGCKILTTHIQ